MNNDDVLENSNQGGQLGVIHTMGKSCRITVLVAFPLELDEQKDGNTLYAGSTLLIQYLGWYYYTYQTY
jgi:hypothetical protein